MQAEVSPFVMLLGLVLPTIIDWMKNSENPYLAWITPETKKILLGASAVLSAISGTVAAYASGTLDADMATNSITMLMNGVATMGIAELAYRHIWKPAATE